MYLITEWERAIELMQRIADIQVARQAALSLGTLAGTLQSDHPWAIELLFGEHGPDVVAWCTVRPSEPKADEPTVKPTGPKPRSGAGAR